MVIIETLEEGRKEDGNRVIADNILKRLHDLEKTIGINQGRWAWELLQNAKDTTSENDDKPISVQITLNDSNVEFRHNGTYFTEKDIRGLINQISSKEVEDDQTPKKTGRFGTGFLTTHLLSRSIDVDGIIKDQTEKYYSFKFQLNREGKTTAELIPKIEKAWSDLHSSATLIESDYNENAYNTSFCFSLLTESQLNVAKIGVTEFLKLIPFVIAAVPKINRVEVIDNISEKNVIFQKSSKQTEENIIQISKNENGEKSTLNILILASNKVSISCEVGNENGSFYIKDLKGIPRLFCDFPLTGTENFYFPLIINSFYFNPTTERNGIWLGNFDDEVEENREILVEAVNLFENLVQYLEENEYSDLYNVAETKLPEVDEHYFDVEWYEDEIQNRLRDIIIKADFVKKYDDQKKGKISDMWFPSKSFSKTGKNKIWEFYTNLYPDLLCKIDKLDNWLEVSWDDWNYLDEKELLKDIEDKNSLGELSDSIKKSKIKTIQWLNEACNFILENDSNLHYFNKYAVIPNQNGNLTKQEDLEIDKIDENELIEILKLLGEDWRAMLIHEKSNLPKLAFSERNRNDISVEITDRIKEAMQSNNLIKEPIVRLLEWFDLNVGLAKELFNEIYRIKSELLLMTLEQDEKAKFYSVLKSNIDISTFSQILEALHGNPKLLENVDDIIKLMEEYDISEVSKLKELILGQNELAEEPKIEITQDILISLGVTSIEDLESALKKSDLSSRFFHTSKPSLHMFLKVKELIHRSKENIKNHLETLSNYDCSEIEEIAPTVFGGIKKDGYPINIVVRPSDNGHIIIFYESEKDTLDYEFSELWIDNGHDIPQHLTLGKILKNTGINRIPV